MTKLKSDKKFHFGEAYAELEQIIAWFEQDDADLEEGIQKFERGLELAKQCKERLADVEVKVSRIKAKFAEDVGSESLA